MIRVHDRQLAEVGRSLAPELFEDEMSVHLRQFSPRHAEAIGDDWVRRAVRLGIERASAYGVTNPGFLRFYVEMMFLFGGTFDTDPLLPWAGDILRDPGLPNEAARMGRLHEAMLAYLAAVDGPERGASLEALRRLRQVLREKIPAADLLVEQNAVDTMTRIHPTFCAFVGEPPLRELVRRASEVAGRLDLGTPPGAVLVAGMTLALGHGFAADPLFPWVRATLLDPSLTSPAARVARLQKRAETYLDRALDYFERRRSDAPS
jgi:hypothetical protein